MGGPGSSKQNSRATQAEKLIVNKTESRLRFLPFTSAIPLFSGIDRHGLPEHYGLCKFDRLKELHGPPTV